MATHLITPASPAKPHEPRASIGLRLAAFGALVFLYVPLLVIILYAFTTDRQTYQFPPPGLTLNWFSAILQRQDFWQALLLSLEVAIVATLIALLLGSICAAALYRSQFFGKGAINLLILLPIALPGIVTGMALRSGIVMMGLKFGIWTVVIGHATFCIVTVYNNVVARLRRTAYSQIEASADLGATTFQTLRYVILPNIASALLAGGLLSFALSFDEVIVTTFTSDTKSSSTLPIWIFGQLTKPHDRPVTNVAALIVIVITMVPILVAYRYTNARSD